MIHAMLDPAVHDPVHAMHDGSAIPAMYNALLSVASFSWSVCTSLAVRVKTKVDWVCAQVPLVPTVLAKDGARPHAAR